MRKNKIIPTVVGIILVFILVFVVICINVTDNKKAFNKDGILYAVTVNGKGSNSFPSKGLYRVDTNCQNARGKWDYNNWKMYVDKIEGKASCDITFTTITKQYINNYIISLSGTSQGTGQIGNENGYRYEGNDPNNYIWFNNELWRIIGVFGSETHGVANTNLTKIIREGSIGTLVWDKSGGNNWKTSSLKALLNGAYYNKQDGTNSGYCYGSGSAIPANCDYKEIGIDSVYRPMIKNVTWYLGGYSDISIAVGDYYTYERGTTVYSGNATTDTGYIGLMYPSDYGYSNVVYNACGRAKKLDAYNDHECLNRNWLYGKGSEWTITAMSDSNSHAYRINSSGSVGNATTYRSLASTSGSNLVRPTLYLDSSVYVLDGDGSITDPYIIGM